MPPPRDTVLTEIVELLLVVPQYTPMVPTLVASPFHRAGWVYEEKIDGYRMLAYKDARACGW